MAFDMLGAIIPKDISLCSVVAEIARQIDHFTRDLVDFIFTTLISLYLSLSLSLSLY